MICARPAVTVVLAALLLTGARRGESDDNHYQSFLVGERAVGLGGAFTAISDDSSGAYYNPGGLAEAPVSSLSLSSALYGFASQRYRIGELGFESDNRTFVSYPTTAAWIQRVRRGDARGVGRVQLALSIITPQSDVTRRRLLVAAAPQPSGTPGQVRQVQQLRVLASEDETLWFGLSAAWKISNWLCAGVTLYGTRRTGLYQISDSALVIDADETTLRELGRTGLAQLTDLTFSHHGLLGVVGAVVRVTDGLRLGAAFRTPQLGLRGRAEFNAAGTVVDQNSGSIVLQASDIPGATFRDRQPFRATLGVAYLVPRRFGVSADVSIYGPVGEYAVFEDRQDPSLAQAVRMKKRLTWQVNAGGEYYVASSFPLRLGFFTDRSSLASFETCDSSGQCAEHTNLFTDGVDLYGAAGSVGWETSHATLTLGASYARGSELADSGGLALETARSYLFVMLGGSFRF